MIQSLMGIPTTFSNPTAHLTVGASLQETLAEAPTRYYRLDMWSLFREPNQIAFLETHVFFFLSVPINLQIFIRLSACTFGFTNQSFFESAKGLT